MNYEVQPPDFEVIIRVNASDVVVAAGFIVAEDDIDVLVGVEKPTDVPKYQRLLAVAGAALDNASWFALDDVDIFEVDGEEDDDGIPF